MLTFPFPHVDSGVGLTVDITLMPRSVIEFSRALEKTCGKGRNCMHVVCVKIRLLAKNR